MGGSGGWGGEVSSQLVAALSCVIRLTQHKFIIVQLSLRRFSYNVGNMKYHARLLV